MTGIIGQAFLMNIGVLFWWFLGTPSKWCFGRFRKDREKELRTWAGTRRLNLQRMLLTSCDTQAVTGIALAAAGFMQVDELPLYDIALILNLLSISANSYSVLLLYGLRQKSERSRRALVAANETSASTQPWLFLLDARLPISIAYIALYFLFSAHAMERFDNALANHDCLLNYPPQAGNYGTWGLAEAVLMLIITALAYVQRLVPVRRLRWRPRWLLWLYDGFLPAFTLTYFFWNFADIITLKIANRPTLIEDEENKISGFGQVVPVVLLLLPLLALRDLLGDE
ncbi:hypothetical protein B0T16DRAFT_153344 [Cercophora newfieldiana]|uniref:Uncharacterized protein n=1 Tax=Cercophora newfieldiana TaxID=92897 RepID=A0AA39Y4W7_9PEZI|nr:hypothetical protein B0T16DRAFT_153344 [Cercophora newfieldiana]